MPLVKPIRGTLPNRTDPLARNLIGVWLINEGDGDLIADVSGRGNHGTNNGAVWVPGRDGWALDFQGSSDLNFGSSDILDDIENPNGMSISCWFNTPQNDANQPIIIKGRNVNSGYWRFSAYISATRLQFEKSYSTTNLIARASTSVITANTWHHVAMTWDGNNLASGVLLYVDSIEDSSNTSDGVGTKNSDAALDLKIGDAPGDTPEGLRGFTAMWDRVLSSDEIRSLYENPYRLFERRRTTIFVPSGGGTQTLNADAVSVSVTVPDATLQPGSVTLTPSPVVINMTVPDATLSAGSATLIPDAASVQINVPDATLSASRSVTPSPAVVQATVPDGTIQAGSVTLTASPAVVTVVAKTAIVKTGVILAPVVSIQIVAKTPTITRHAPCYSVSCCPPEDLGYDISSASATDSTCGETKSCDCDDPL